MFVLSFQRPLLEGLSLNIASNKSRSDAKDAPVTEMNALRSTHISKQDNRRSLTDFKLVGWTIQELDWEWGNTDRVSYQATAANNRTELDNAETGSPDMDGDNQANKKVTRMDGPAQTSCRLRFYFQPQPADSNAEDTSVLAAGKRKKCDDDDDDEELNVRKTRRRHSPSQLALAEEEVKLPFEHVELPGVSSGDVERNSESDDSDWLLKAIGEDASEGGTAPQSPSQAVPAEQPTSTFALDDSLNSSLHTKHDSGTACDVSALACSVEYVGEKEASADLQSEQSPRTECSTVEKNNNLNQKEELDPDLHELPFEPDAANTAGNLSGEEAIEAKEQGLDHQESMMDVIDQGLESTEVAEAEPFNSQVLPADSLEAARLIKSDERLAPPSVENSPAPNRISILYADSQKRLTIDAAIVEEVNLFRAEGRIEIHILSQADVGGDASRKINVRNQEHISDIS